MDDVLLAKAASIERCLARVRAEYEGTPATLKNLTKQDAIVLNLQRACECAIDGAMRLVRIHGLGIPQDSRQAFDLLVTAGKLNEQAALKMKKMVGFANASLGVLGGTASITCSSRGAASRARARGVRPVLQRRAPAPRSRTNRASHWRTISEHELLRSWTRQFLEGSTTPSDGRLDAKRRVRWRRWPAHDVANTPSFQLDPASDNMAACRSAACPRVGARRSRVPGAEPVLTSPRAPPRPARQGARARGAS